MKMEVLTGFLSHPGSFFEQDVLVLFWAIGAEYGEGFETFRQDGLLKVDVDFLNDRLQEEFLKRIRYAMKPDEAYGLIFSWDVMADTRALKLNAWKQLASEEGKEIPEDGDVRRLILKCRYDLVQADLAVASFDELSVINLRRLFANKGSTFMDRQKQIIEKAPPKTKLTIDTIL